jgi:hypothetical protein
MPITVPRSAMNSDGDNTALPLFMYRGTCSLSSLTPSPALISLIFRYLYLFALKMSIQMENFWQIKLRKDNGTIVNFGFDPNASSEEVEFGIRLVLGIPRTANYTVLFRQNNGEEEVCFAPTGKILTDFVMAKIGKLDVLVEPAMPERPACKLSMEKGSELRPHILLSLNHQ